MKIGIQPSHYQKQQFLKMESSKLEIPNQIQILSTVRSNQLILSNRSLEFIIFKIRSNDTKNIVLNVFEGFIPPQTDKILNIALRDFDKLTTTLKLQVSWAFANQEMSLNDRKIDEIPKSKQFKTEVKIAYKEVQNNQNNDTQIPPPANPVVPPLPDVTPPLPQSLLKAETEVIMQSQIYMQKRIKMLDAEAQKIKLQEELKQIKEKRQQMPDHIPVSKPVGPPSNRYSVYVLIFLAIMLASLIKQSYRYLKNDES